VGCDHPGRRRLAGAVAAGDRGPVYGVFRVCDLRAGAPPARKRRCFYV